MPLKDRPNMAEEIAEYISEKIIRLELAPGARILETKIAEELDVSRSPIRESLRILEKYQLVELIPRKGARVKEMTPEYIANLFDIMIELVGLIARLCCQNRNPDELARMVEFEKEAYISAGKKHLQGYYDALYNFALVALKAARNPLLAQMIQDWLPGFRRAYYFFLSHSPFNLSESAKMFHEVIRHFVDKNYETAEKKVKAYTRMEKDRVLEILNRYLN
jgi:DNA-binding GntR family transcriptional regulator